LGHQFKKEGAYEYQKMPKTFFGNGIVDPIFSAKRIGSRGFGSELEAGTGGNV
jgi:hypothetical protein